MVNPWKVNSIDAFSYLKCPECEFDSKAESKFKNHAIKNHPLSHVFFGNDNTNKVSQYSNIIPMMLKNIFTKIKKIFK